MSKTLVIGASENPDRYAYKAAVSLLNHGHEIELFGNKAGEVRGVKFQLSSQLLFLIWIL